MLPEDADDGDDLLKSSRLLSPGAWGGGGGGAHLGLGVGASEMMPVLVRQTRSLRSGPGGARTAARAAAAR